MGIIALALSGVGLSRANKLGGVSRGMAITGIVTGAVALVVGILIIAAFVSTVHSLQQQYPTIFSPTP